MKTKSPTSNMSGPSSNSIYTKTMLTASEKRANDFEWYKNNINFLISCKSNYHTVVFDENKKPLRRYNKMKVNYDLCDNILNLDDFANVVKPYGIDMGMMPVNFENYDIISSKVNTLRGLQKRYPFKYVIRATNTEATTRQLEKENELMKESLESIIMGEIDQQLQAQVQQIVEQQGGKLSREQQEAILQQVAQAREVMTPKEVALYMERDYKDPAEIAMNHLLEYYKKKLNIYKLVNDCFDDYIKVGRAILYKGIFNNEPSLLPIKPMRFYYELNDTSNFIEDGEWCIAEYRMSTTMIASLFGDELKQDELKELTEYGDKYNTELNYLQNPLYYAEFEEEDDDAAVNDKLSVYHGCWRGLRKVGFAKITDMMSGETQVMMVDDSFKSEVLGFIQIEVEWRWIPEIYETWKVKDKYFRMRPVEGQFKDIDSIYDVKLPYIGVVQNSNSNRIVSVVDRIKPYQYMLDILMFRINIALSNDKGTKLLLNSQTMVKDDAITPEEWLATFNSTGIGLINPNDYDGAGANDLANVAKVLNMNGTPDMNGYLKIVDYLKEMAREASNIPRQLEGQMFERDGAAVTSQAIQQSSVALYSMFELFNQFKTNIITYLIEDIKICYRSISEVTKSYITDDMDEVYFTVNGELLDNATYGLFVEDASISEDIRSSLYQLIHASLQNQTIEFSRAIDLLEQNNITEAKELLAQAEAERKKREDAIRQESFQQQQQILQMQMEAKQKEHEMKLKEILLKEEERRKTELAKQAYLGASYNPDVDVSPKNNINDYFEMARMESNRDYEAEKKENARKQDEINSYRQQQVENEAVRREDNEE